MNYTIKRLTKISGVSVRTLHYYDQIGLLKPSVRTEAGYRLYGEQELLRLQQILFYRELDIPLKDICDILDDPDFDLLKALQSHKTSLSSRKDRIIQMLETIDKTIENIKNGGDMLDPEELYKGLPKETAKEYRDEAIEKYGKDTVERSENHLRKMSKEEFAKLGAESGEIREKLFSLMNEDPTSPEVQEQIARHYANIRVFWGTSGCADPQAEAYEGLGQLYVNDERFTMINGKPNPEYALFLSKAMSYFAKKQLKK